MEHEYIRVNELGDWRCGGCGMPDYLGRFFGTPCEGERMAPDRVVALHQLWVKLTPYTSRGAGALKSYAAAHPEDVVWSPETGWR